MLHQAKRPKKAPRRHRCGKIVQEQRAVGPTAETLAKKIGIAGSVDKIHLTYSVIAVLQARGMITEQERSAGEWYASLWRYRFGNPHPRSAMVEVIAGAGRPSAIDPAIDEEKTDEYWRAVKNLTTIERLAVTDIAVYDMWPAVLRSVVCGRIPDPGALGGPAHGALSKLCAARCC